MYADCSNKGISIIVWSRNDDYSDMAFVVDHIDRLVSEWYPGNSSSETEVISFRACSISLELCLNSVDTLRCRD